MSSNTNVKYIVFLSVVSALGGFLFGYDTAVISGTIARVSNQFSLDTFSQGWYVGCALLGSIFGVMCAGVMSDYFGRKKTLLLAAFLFSVSAIGCALANTFETLVVMRIVGGVGVGIVSIVSPLYISEISIPKYRGQLVALYQLAITVGFLAAFLVNYGLLQYSTGGAETLKNPIFYRILGSEMWRGMLGAETIPAIIFFAIIFLIPESPRWLILMKREAKAELILRKISVSSEAASFELEEVKKAIAKKSDSNWKMLLNPNIRKSILIGVGIAILGQFMGVNAVLYYGPSIFESSGLSGSDSLFYQVIVGLVNMLTTVLAIAIIDKVGRKKLVYYGVSGMVISLLLIAFYFTKGEALGISSIVLLFFFLAYIFSCAISICAVIWVLLSEMYPTKVRGIAMSIAGLSLWIGTFLIGQLTPWLLETLRPQGTFILFALMCVPYMLIIWKLVPETTGKSLEEIEKHWD